MYVSTVYRYTYLTVNNIIHFVVADYDKALQKLKQAELTSDLGTDIEELTRKRKPVPRKRLYVEDSDSSVEGELPRPPKIICAIPTSSVLSN